MDKHPELSKEVTEVSSDSEDDESIEERDCIMNDEVIKNNWKEALKRRICAAICTYRTLTTRFRLSVKLYDPFEGPHCGTYQYVLGDIVFSTFPSLSLTAVDYLQQTPKSRR